MSQALLVLAALLALAALPHVPGAPAVFHRKGATILTLGLLLLPHVPALLGRGPAGYRLVIPPTGADLRPGLLATVLVLPAFHLAVLAGWLPAPPGAGHVPAAELPVWVLVHLLNVVLPEELFFRGFLQERLDPGGGPVVLGARLHRGVLLQAIAFGALHVVSYGGVPAAFDRALPGLAFGALRARTGNVWSAALFHLACNLYLLVR